MQKFTTSDGLNLAFMDEGTGPAVLCLNGLTRTYHDFDDMAAAVSGVRLIRMDSRGRGQSDYDPDFNNYTVPVESRDALELLDHLGIEKTAVIGTSRGGIIAMVLARTVKHRLSGVLLNDIGPELAAGGLDSIVEFLGKKPPFATFEEAAADFATNNTGFANVPYARWLTVAQRLFKQVQSGLDIRYDPKLRDAVLAGTSTLAPDLWPLFDAMDGLPLALLRGENSDLLTATAAAEMQRRRPDMLFAEVKDRAHIPFLDEPESLKIINAFIERIS